MDMNNSIFISNLGYYKLKMNIGYPKIELLINGNQRLDVNNKISIKLVSIIDFCLSKSRIMDIQN